MLKWRRNLGVTGFLPPPGGAHAAQMVMSCSQEQTRANKKVSNFRHEVIINDFVLWHPLETRPLLLRSHGSQVKVLPLTERQRPNKSKQVSTRKKPYVNFFPEKFLPVIKSTEVLQKKKNNYNNSYWTRSCFIIKKLLHSPRRKNSKEKRHVTFAIFLKKRAVEDVNFIQRTWYCLSNSIGGCAPYVSSFGMFKSSTKMIIRLPAGAPKATNIASSH